MPQPLDPTACRPRYPRHARVVPTLYDSLKSHG
jgi:hypothetical protein